MGFNNEFENTCLYILIYVMLLSIWSLYIISIICFQNIQIWHKTFDGFVELGFEKNIEFGKGENVSGLNFNG